MEPQVQALRLQSLAIFQAAVAAADPYLAVTKALRAEGRQLQIRLNADTDTAWRIGDWSQIQVLAFGKAACAMARAARDVIPAELFAETGLAVTTYENFTQLEHFDVFAAGHPLPDLAGFKAAQLIAERARAASAKQLVLILVSGGGSALLPLPVNGVSLAEKIHTTNLLLACGANINEINCVRKHLSQLKGGGLARMVSPADLHALILSDVLGDDVSAIASGPTVADDSRFSDAVSILKSYQVWDSLPDAVRDYLNLGLQNPQLETLKSGDEIFKHTAYTLVGSNAISLSAALAMSEQAGFQIEVYSRQLSGEARLVAEQMVAYAKSLQLKGLKQAIAIIAGGETTVTLTGKGKGGRNQEMALAFALAAERQALKADWVFLSGGSDGRDGPTDAAGALVDAESLQRMRQAGCSPEAHLLNNDAYPALQAANDLLITGATGTNVADLQILLLQGERI